MRYKVVYQFKWLLIIAFIILVYLSNFILIELPFIRIHFPEKDVSKGLFVFLLSFFPRFSFEFQIYNIQTVIAWVSGVALGARIGAVALCIYLAFGFIGLPIFASGGGFDYYKEPTFGYLISLPINAFLSGWFFEKKQRVLAAFVPMFTTHLLGILYLFLFRQSWLDISWHISFSMISYDLIFALLLTPIMPTISFVLNEMFAQEVPVRSLYSSEGGLEVNRQRIIKN